ncbi:MAG TPA: efflux RND transporter periplasmic adaptor subunit [Fimbriiglobus sp.]
MRSTFPILVILLVTGCGSPATSTPPRDRLVRVETTVPTVETFPIRVDLSATVEPLYRVDVCARVTGVVAEFFPANLDVGQRVAAGAPILRLDVPELDAQREQRKAALALAKDQVGQAKEAERVAEQEVIESEAQLKRYAADVKYRRLETKRVTELSAKGVIQPERVEEAERQLDVAEATADAARAAVDTKKVKRSSAGADRRTAESRVSVAAADLKTTEEMIALATIKAPPPSEGIPSLASNDVPSTYIVTRRNVDRGATVKDSAQTLLTLMQLETVRVLVDVSERDVPAVEELLRNSKNASSTEGNAVLTLPALREAPSHGVFRGRIARTAGVIDPTTRTMRTEIEFDNRRGDLRPGMFGTMTLTLGTRTNALILPSSSFVRRDSGPEVLVVDPSADNPARGVVRVVPVKIGYDDGRRVQVTAGLTGKERVIVRGNTPITTGDLVIPVESRLVTNGATKESSPNALRSKDR